MALLTIFIAGCQASNRRVNVAAKSEKPSSEADPITKIPVQSHWRFNPHNPILRLGDLRPLATWNDPCVLKLGKQYVMYLTTALRQPGSPPVLPFRAVSADGLKWRLDPPTPLLQPGPVGSFDAASVETPSVARFRNQYHLYYTGVGSAGLTGPMSIGHAVSEDGIHWKKDARPVLTPTGNKTDWNGYQVAEPAAVVFRGRLYLYFAAVGLRKGEGPPASRVIGLATSVNGRDFGPPEPVLKPNALYSPHQGFDGYSTPAAAVSEGKMHLFYDVGYFDASSPNPWTQVALHHAVSPDGRTHWLQDREAIVARRHARWTGLEVRAPSPLFDGNRLRLWFAGNADPKEFIQAVQDTRRTDLFGIGYAESTLPSQKTSPTR
jgi:predicted GH43/DUF377 family glycosyl hydrolase